MGSLQSTLNKVRWSLAQRGVMGTARVWTERLTGRRAANGKLSQHPFDAHYGVETSGLIHGWELASGHAHDAFNVAYYGIAPSRCRGALQRWLATPPLRPIESYTFVDVGCGKGRAVLLASELPFREAIGVELNAGLAATAVRNIEAWSASGRARCPVRIVCQDAAEFVLPEGPCLLYLYNPFAAPVLRRFLERVEATAGERGRVLDVLYQNPEAKELFAGYGRLWSEVIARSAEDQAVDSVSSEEELCNAYRR
jgi:SAM-dependent methyltransferase